VARRYGVSRQAVHGWLGRYKREGLTGLADRSHRPRYQLRQLDAGIEALICQWRGAHPWWGPRRLLFELGQARVSPLPSRSTIYRALVRHGLVPARKRKRRRQDYKRWQRGEPMQPPCQGSSVSRHSGQRSVVSEDRRPSFGRRSRKEVVIAGGCRRGRERMGRCH
jgi:transposase